jgi:hypothetical protein
MISNDDLLHAIARSSNEWLEGNLSWRHSAVQALCVSTGQKENEIVQAISNAVCELRYEPLKAFATGELAPFLESGRGAIVLHVLPANVFTAWLPAVVTTLLMGFQCWLKPSSRERIFPTLWRDSMIRADARLESQIELVEWQTADLGRVTNVVGFGSDKTLDHIESACPPGVRVVRYGSKLSVAVIFADSLEAANLSTTIERLATDANLFELQGCLSPQIVFTQGPAKQLVNEVRPRLSTLPQFRAWDSLTDLKRMLSELGQALSCVGIAGNSGQAKELKRTLAQETRLRVCPLGEMQRPDLWWKNGGIFLPERLVQSNELVVKGHQTA